MSYPDISIPYVEPTAPPPQNQDISLPLDEKKIHYESDTNNNRTSYTKLYTSILSQISNHFTSKYNYILSEWTVKDNQCNAYIWNKDSIFLAHINIVFKENKDDVILSHTMQVSIDTYHKNMINGWDIFSDHHHHKFTYTNGCTLKENHSLLYLYKDIYKIITPYYLYPQKKMTIWNILDGSYFVSAFSKYHS